MTILLTGTGGLFTRIGLIGGVLSDTNIFQNTLETDSTNIYNQFQADISQEQIIDGIGSSLVSGQQSAENYIQYLQGIATGIITTMVAEDTGLLNSDVSLQIALNELITQMLASSDSILELTIGATPTAGGSNQGNGICVPSTYRADGLIQQNTLGETISLTIAEDSTNGTQAGSELWQANGQITQSDTLSNLWPAGSAATQSISSINPTNNDDGIQLLNNGDFEEFTVSNVPNNFIIATGTAGVQVFQGSTAYTGVSSLQYAGDSSTNTAVQQLFNNAAGTTETLQQLTLYSVNLWISCDVTPAAGALQVALVDVGGTVINDDQGNPNSFTHSLTALSTSWVAINATFRTPYLLPNEQFIRLKLTTALSTGTNLFMDRLGFGLATQMYPGGPTIAMFSGSNNWYFPDTFTVAAN